MGESRIFHTVVRGRASQSSECLGSEDLITIANLPVFLLKNRIREVHPVLASAADIYDIYDSGPGSANERKSLGPITLWFRLIRPALSRNPHVDIMRQGDSVGSQEVKLPRLH